MTMIFKMVENYLERFNNVYILYLCMKNLKFNSQDIKKNVKVKDIESEKNDLIKSFKRAAKDPEMLEIAEEGMENYLEMLKRFE